MIIEFFYILSKILIWSTFIPLKSDLLTLHFDI